MFRFRLVGLALLAVCVVGITAAPASAANCVKEGTTHTLCILKVLLEKATTVDAENIKGNVATLLTPAVQVLCKHVTTSGEILTPLGKNVTFSNIILKFSECGVDKPANCTVKEGKIQTVALSGTVVSDTEVLFFPTKGSLFATIVIEGGKCLIAGSNNVTTEGKVEGEHGPLCTAADIETEKPEHELVCEEPKSHLEFRKEKAEFSSKENLWVLPLVSEKKDEWSIKLAI